MAAVLRQIDLVTRFVGYQRAYSTKSGIETAIEGCRSLLQEQDINSAVRKGDIYGFLIEHYSKIQNYRYVIANGDRLCSSYTPISEKIYMHAKLLVCPCTEIG